MEQLTSSMPTLTPELVRAFEGLEAVALLGLCFFVLLAIVIPVTLAFVLRNHVKEMDLVKTAFQYSLDKRDEDQRKITEALDRMLESLNARLSALERKIDHLNPAV